ncbi:MAG TPA: YncE family protein [Vicinamibacterales bacterium]|nr:YncE family protein [Vicinamibacterales bacterium]
MRRAARPLVAAAAAMVLSTAASDRGQRQAPAAGAYYAYACAESDDTIALVRFTPGRTGGGRLEVVKTIDVGVWPTEIEGPHGIGVHPDGRHWFVSLSHGNPFGSVWKMETGTDRKVAAVEAGLFPASLDVAGSTNFLYVVNFNLYGDMTPSTVSVIETGEMIEIARVPTGIMPHGSRLDASGTRQYHVSMMDDLLHEIDAAGLRELRTLPLSPHAGHAMSADTPDARAAMKAMMADMVQPTWATQPTRDGKVYVAGNRKNVLLEVDLASWTIARTFANTGDGIYNLDVTPDGRWLVATYKRGAAVGIWDLRKGIEAARIPTTRRVPHGVVITPDQRFAFVTNEGVGGEPGTVEVYDLSLRKRAAAVDIGKQAGGIAFWKAEPR